LIKWIFEYESGLKILELAFSLQLMHFAAHQIQKLAYFNMYYTTHANWQTNKQTNEQTHKTMKTSKQIIFWHLRTHYMH